MSLPLVPLVAATMVALGYLSYLTIDRFAKRVDSSMSSRHRRAMRIARTVGLLVASSSLITLQAPDISYASGLAASLRFAALLIVVAALIAALAVATAWLVRAIGGFGNRSTEPDPVLPAGTDVEPRWSDDATLATTPVLQVIRPKLDRPASGTFIDEPAGLGTGVGGEASTDSAVDRLDALVVNNSHDLDTEPLSAISASLSIRSGPGNDAALMVATNEYPLGTEIDEGSPSRIELVRELERTGLENVKLKRLVIAQRARLQSGQEALGRAREAVSQARAERATAIKFARRERVQRLKFEGAAKRSEAILANVLARLPSSIGDTEDGAAPPATGTAQPGR